MKVRSLTREEKIELTYIDFEYALADAILEATTYDGPDLQLPHIAERKILLAKRAALSALYSLKHDETARAKALFRATDALEKYMPFN